MEIGNDDIVFFKTWQGWFWSQKRGEQTGPKIGPFKSRREAEDKCLLALKEMHNEDPSDFDKEFFEQHGCFQILRRSFPSELRLSGIPVQLVVQLVPGIRVRMAISSDFTGHEPRIVEDPEERASNLLMMSQAGVGVAAFAFMNRVIEDKQKHLLDLEALKYLTRNEPDEDL